MPVHPEVRHRATHLSHSVKAGLPPLGAAIAILATLIGGDILITLEWGVRHLYWGLIIFLLVLFVVAVEGTYREGRRHETDHAEQIAGMKRELEALATTPAQETPAPADVDPAEWEPVCNESGTDRKDLTFGLNHRFDHPAAFLAFNALRCTVTDPDQITTSATGRGRYYQYTQAFFEGAPPVRPGLYRFTWEGRNAKGAWVTITRGEHTVQPWAKTGLEVVIDDEKPTWFPGIGLILEIEYHVTNHDPVPHMLKRSLEGSITGRFYFPLADQDDLEHTRFRHEYGRISERRRWELLPPRVEAGETVRGVYIEQFAWDPATLLPDYTLIINDGRHQYKTRPHGADPDPLAA